MLSLSNISVSYDGSRILRNVSLAVPPGKVVCLMGRNGVGKTTTLKSILGLVKLDAGSIKLYDVDLTTLKPEQRIRQGLGYVPQSRDIFPSLTVMENLRIGAVAQGKKLNGEVQRILELFPVLKEMTQRKGGILSGGQQQQLAIGRALLTNPKVLLLDEPTEGIQPNIIDQIGETIKRLRQNARSSGVSPGVARKGDAGALPKPASETDASGPPTPDFRSPSSESGENLGQSLQKLREEGRIGILLVEQYLDFCLDVGDSFYIMDRGSVVAEGPIGRLNDDIVKQHLTV